MPKAKRLRFKVLAPHVAGCPAMQRVRTGQLGTTWAYLNVVERRDKIGRRNEHGGQRWWLSGCNHINCTAVIAVDETSILEMLPHE